MLTSDGRLWTIPTLTWVSSTSKRRNCSTPTNARVFRPSRADSRAAAVCQSLRPLLSVSYR